MQVSIENTGSLSREMSITVPSSDIEKMAENRLNEIQKTMKTDGFRLGKVPMSMVEKQYGERIIGEITEQVISSSISKAFTDENIRPAGQPTMKKGGLPEKGKDYSFTVTFDIFPEIKPSGYENLKLTKEIAEPSDKMVAELLERLANSRQTFSAKDGEAVNGDQVTINSTGYLKDKDTPFEGGELKTFPLVLGSGRLIPGFEAGLEGVKAGDKLDLAVIFPKEYHSKELAGKPAIFKTEIISVESPAVPEFNDEFAVTFGEKSMKTLTEVVRKQIIADMEAVSYQGLKKNLFDALDKNNQFDIPETLLEHEFNSIWNQNQQEMKTNNVTFKDLKTTEDESRTEYRALAERRVRLGLLLAEIGKTAEVKVEKTDIDAEIEAMAAQNPMQAQQVKEHYGNPQNQNELVGPLFERKVSDWLINQATVTEKTIDAEKLMKGFM